MRNEVLPAYERNRSNASHGPEILRRIVGFYSMLMGRHDTDAGAGWPSRIMAALTR